MKIENYAIGGLGPTGPLYWASSGTFQHGGMVPSLDPPQYTVPQTYTYHMPRAIYPTPTLLSVTLFLQFSHHTPAEKVELRKKCALPATEQ